MVFNYMSGVCLPTFSSLFSLLILLKIYFSQGPSRHMEAPLVMRRLEGKVAIVTGGAGGIGEAIVRLFSKHGAKLIICDINEEAGRKVEESLPPSLAKFICCDTSKEEDVSAAVDLAVETYGQLDIMINNAGIMDFNLECHTGLEASSYDMETFDRVMNINVKGVMHGIKHASRVMIPIEKGCIVSTASVCGTVGGLTTYAYTASKHAVIGLTKTAAAEHGRYGIRVNCVSPFGILTGIDKRNAYLEEEDRACETSLFEGAGNLAGHVLCELDVAEAMLYLAGDEAKYVSGHNFVVDGGLTAVNNTWGVHPQ